MDAAGEGATGQFFVAASEYLVDGDVILEHLSEHRAWAKQAYDAGVLLFSGRQDPPVGGVLCFKVEDRAAAERFVASDPFAVAGVARYVVTAFTPTHFPWRSTAFDAFATGR